MQKSNKGPLSEFAIVSLVLGILSFLQLAGLEKAIAAVVFGILSLKKIAAAESKSRGESLAAAGIVLGVVYAVIAGIAVFALLKNPALLEQIRQWPVAQ